MNEISNLPQSLVDHMQAYNAYQFLLLSSAHREEW